MRRFFNLHFLLLLSVGCQSPSEHHSPPRRVEKVGNWEDGARFALPPPEEVEIPKEAWEPPPQDALPLITLEHFRCRGSYTHPFRPTEREEKPFYLADCNGKHDHSLPIREGKEFVFPILVTLLNHVQEKLGERVVVTAGHRCPTHQLYIDDTFQGETSKHQVGAEVAFYVEGFEERPEEVVKVLMAFYAADESPQMAQFQRYEKGDTNVRTQPWYNREVFIKLFEADEGRDVDNDHAYPYIAIQVRWDRETKERVQYTWPLAHKGYYRSPC